MKKILFILSGNLSTTPRALKSIQTAKKFYDADIIAINRNPVWKSIDDILVEENNFNYTTVSLLRKPFFAWLLNSGLNKLSGFLYPFFSKNLKISAYSSSKAIILLDRELKNRSKNYDLIIAHSYGSLYPAYKISAKQKIPFTFDIEDFHPGEIMNSESKTETERRRFLMQQILPHAGFITYASPLIGTESLKLIPDFPLYKHGLINNGFSGAEFQFKENGSEKIRFVWFSQTINSGRGLELIVWALEKFKDRVELSLIGNLNSDFYRDFLLQYSDFIKIEKPLPQKELNRKLSEFDVGLAIELSSADFNRDICLTNKIFSYAQSGLYILATNTSAQKIFINENPQLGCVGEQAVWGFETEIRKIIDNITQIRRKKSERFEHSSKFAFENESRKILNIWLNLTSKTKSKESLLDTPIEETHPSLINSDSKV
jgi:hypothetical protein